MKTYKHWFWLGLQALFAFALLFGLTSPAHADIPDPRFVWAKGMGGSETDGGESITIDSAGNVYTLGTFTGTVDFDPGPGTVNLTSKGTGDNEDLFITKHDSRGNLLWAKSMGGDGYEGGISIAVDSEGNILTTGYFLGSADFDPGPGEFILSRAGIYEPDIFISKLDSNGNFVWAKRLGSENSDMSFDIKVDASGNLYTTGFFEGTVDFDPGSGIYNLTGTGHENTFVSKLDKYGNFVWAKAINSTASTEGNSIELDNAGNIYITGIFSETTDFDPGAGTFNLISAGGSDIFITKLDSSGNFLWAKSMGGYLNDSGQSVVVDDSGNIHVLGIFKDTADFDPGEDTYHLTSAGNYDIFISKLDNSGNFLWAKAIGGSELDKGNGMALDGSGNLYITGWFLDTVDFDPGAGTYNLTSAGDKDIFISKLGSNGDFVWAKGIGGSLTDAGIDIALSSDGSIYTTGTYFDTVDFDPGEGTFNMTGAGLTDAFISKLGNPDNIEVYVNQQLRGSYVVPVDGRITPRYWENGGYTGPGLQAGPVKVTSPTHDTFFTSERVHFPGTDSSKWTAFNEVMGLPTERLSTEYYFTWYDNLTMYTWVLVGNPSTTETAEVDIYIGGTLRGHYSIEPGQRVTPRYWENGGFTGPGLQAGPVRVVSTNGVKIFASERTHFTTPPWTGFNEVIGYPVEDLDSEYWFPWYDNDSMLTWVLVGNPSETETAEVDISIAGVDQETFDLGPRQTVTKTYADVQNGPVKVVSTNLVPIITSERVKYKNSTAASYTGFNELMGFPESDLSDEYWFTWYDNSTMVNWVLVGR